MTSFDISERTGRIFLAGEWAAAGGGVQDVVCPSDGSSRGSIGLAPAEDVDKAVAAAVSAQRDWAARVFDDRAKVLRTAATLLEANSVEYVDWLIEEAGSARGKAVFETAPVVSELHFAAALALAPTGQVMRGAKPCLARRVPVGVVGVISPFNFPGVLSMHSIAPATALGNAVVLKPDPRTAVTGGLFFAQLFSRAGLPDGLLSVLPGAAPDGGAPVEHPAVISFTGSTAAGRNIGECSGRLLKRAHLELGGNALVVLVNVDAAASAGAWGSFLHQGRVCMTTGRHLVHAAVYDRDVETLAASADRLRVSDPRTSDAPTGPILDEHQRGHVHELVTASVDAGARLAADRTHHGLFYRPTVLAELRPEHPDFAEELLGPVASVLRFEDKAELVEIVNRSEYGLSHGILTRDVVRGPALAERLPSGIVHINDQTVDDESVPPFGGMAASGTGARFGGVKANAEAFTETRWMTAQGAIPRYPFWPPWPNVPDG